MTPRTLSAFLDEQIPKLAGEPPDADWIAIIADMHGTTPEVVWQGVRAKMPSAPVVPPPFVPPPLPPDVVVERRPTSPSSVVARTFESPRSRGFDAVVLAFRQHGHELKANRKGFITRCPLHPDRRPSLQISRGHDGRTALVYCHSCKRDKTKAIVATVGLTPGDLFPDDRTASRARVREVLAEYRYVSMAGTLVATKVRYRDAFHVKRFGWRVGARWKLTDDEKTGLPLYRERDLIECSTIYITEGEKAVDRLWDAGLPATCAPHGAGIWEPRWTDSLRVLGAQQVVVLTDNDAPGRKHGELVAAALHADHVDVRVVALSDLGASQDIYDWFALGHTSAELEAIAQATPTWRPGLTEALRLERRRALTYARVIKYREKQRQRMSDIRSVTQPTADIRRVTPSAARESVTLKRCNADERSSDQHSKDDDSSCVSSELDPLWMNEERDSVTETSTSFCRDLEFILEIHRGGDHDDGDDDDDAVRAE